MADKKQIGLTPAAAQHMAALMETKWFEDRQHAYRTAIAVALARGSVPREDEVSNVTTAYNFIGGVDKDGQLRALIAALAPGEAARPAAYSERLAQAGLAYLAERFSDESVLLSEVLEPVGAAEVEAEQSAPE